MKTVCWSSFNCLIKQLQNHPCSHRNNSSQAAALSGKCMRRRQSNGLLASLIRNVRSGCLQAGGVQKSVSHLAVTRHICVAVLLEKLLPSAGPRLICLGLSVRRLHQKGTGDLKAPSFHRSTSFFPFCSHLLSPNLFLRRFCSDGNWECKHFVPAAKENGSSAGGAQILMLTTIYCNHPLLMLIKMFV